MSATKLRRVDHEPARMARRARMRTLRADAIAIATTAGADATIGMAAMVTATTTADGTRTFGGVESGTIAAAALRRGGGASATTPTPTNLACNEHTKGIVRVHVAQPTRREQCCSAQSEGGPGPTHPCYGRTQIRFSATTA